jgi:hypothetical protein
MGSDIHVTSQVGAGSTFWFELEAPVVETEAAALPERLVTGYRAHASLLAKGYQSKAIPTLVERYLETRPGA